LRKPPPEGSGGRQALASGSMRPAAPFPVDYSRGRVALSHRLRVMQQPPRIAGPRVRIAWSREHRCSASRDPRGARSSRATDGRMDSVRWMRGSLLHQER
jgi:hypothetical protein